MTKLVRSIGVAVVIAVGGCGGSDEPSVPEDAAADATAPSDGGVDADRPTDAGSDAPADAGERLGPPYPVVLAHGFFGFDDFAGAGFVQYWYGIPEHLAAVGEMDVHVTTVDPFNDSTVRGGQLVERIEEILAASGHAKVNVIGHSQGGLDARVVAFERPDLVASVTTIGAPHRGSPIADVVVGLLSDGRFADLVDELVRTVGAPLYDEVGDETSVVTALRQFSSEGIASFNLRYPDRIDVDYYSIAGVSDREWGADCRNATAVPPFVDRWRDRRDPIDPLFRIAEAIADGDDIFAPQPNDGLVRVADARWGRFLGCIPADHLDEVGQLLGDDPGLLNDFDYLAFYEELVAFLRAEGH